MSARVGTGGVVDVLVIGAGASGGVVAKRFVDAGLRVMCLEQGDWPDPAAYPGSRPEFELLAAKQWSSSPAVRGSTVDYPVDITDSDLGVVNFNGVGGGTVLYNAQWPRMLPDDFRTATVDGVAADWPLGYSELQPYYEEIDRQFGVSGLGGNPAYPPGVDPPLPPLPIGDLATRVARAHAELGWHWWPATNAILSVEREGRHACVQRGTCGSGCNEGAKGSTDVTHWAHVVAAGGTVVTRARVRRVVLDERGLACGADWVDADGRERHQAADVVVLACNAIGTARLLLASATARQPDGLANSSGLVGRNLMLHPLVGVSGFFENADADGWRAHNGALIQSLQFARSDVRRGFVRGATWALGTSGGPLAAALAPGGPPAWGATHHRHVGERLGRTASWVVICEDLPEEHNRVTLSAALVDSDGMPAPELHYRLAPNTRRMMRWNEERAQESLLSAGAHRVEVRSHAANGHFMGTARMGTDPSRSVVDVWGRCHDVPNLLVVDGSVFVTAGSANPTSTIAALALRSAQHLIEHASSVLRPQHRSASTSMTVAAVDRESATAVDAPVRRGGGSATTVPVPGDGLDEDQREVFAMVAALLIPAADGMPSARDVGVCDHLLDRFLAARPDLFDGLVVALGAVDREVAVVADLDLLDAGARRSLEYAAAGCYYLADAVRARLGFRTTDPRPVRPDAFPAYVEAGLLDHMI